MVSKYLKALALTIILLSLGLVLISYLDQLRFNAIADSIEETSLEVQSTQQLLLYESIFGEDQDICGILNERIGVQISATQKALRDLDNAESQNFLANSELLKKRFLNQNIALYLLVEKARRDCGNTEIEPILYFYSEKVYSGEAASQAKILDSLVLECETARVFALPIDLEIPVVDVIKAKHGVSEVPSIVIKEQRIDGLTSKQDLKEKLSC
ncbi:hypothetical protein IIC68_01935 [archaeon]|nr:hypothetical protein [archaeon]